MKTIGYHYSKRDNRQKPVILKSEWMRSHKYLTEEEALREWEKIDERYVIGVEDSLEFSIFEWIINIIGLRRCFENINVYIWLGWLWLL